MRRLFFGLLLIAGMMSCDQHGVYHEYQDLPAQWHQDSTVTFQLKMEDSLQPYDAFITLRNTNDYPFSNLFLITKMEFPYGKVITDTLEYRMAASDGQWLGTGFSELKENKLWYKEQVRFRESGVYHLHIRPAMRRMGEVQPLQALPGITQVGLRIERVEEQ
ncbi:gliding motility lipoprotein GldH [Croceiramulus getboli]|nr:gliding motility lipoprotein GldH [Flavobacteriaceae bacterium YJPT1-3]